ncbi:MAG: purine-nucleoside phosphorylase [Planctomycetota bacterium]|nr:purine-nucleoside phosphorylase [Planctomycetota bacterium]
MSEWQKIQRAIAAIRRRGKRRIAPKFGVVLGSGLASALPLDRPGVAIPYSAIPGFPRAKVEGHGGRLRIGAIAGRPAAVLEGRVHLYEGHSFESIVLPVRSLIAWGVETLIITNAAGGIRPSLRAGQIMGIQDHLNLQATGPSGPFEPRLGPRFIPMRDAYDPALLRQAASAARQESVPFRKGVYAGVRGPAYESPAELRMLRALGADAVGMSTVPEVIAARQMGARCLGLSLITNSAAGHHAGKVTHDEVLSSGELHGKRLGRLIARLIDSDPD